MEIPGLEITYPYEGTSPGVARLQCDECGQWERSDKKPKGAQHAGQILHRPHCESRPQLPHIADAQAAAKKSADASAKDRRLAKLAEQLRRTGSAVGFTDEEVLEAQRLRLISESTAMNLDD